MYDRNLGPATIDWLRHGAYKVVLDGKSYWSTKSVPKNTKKQLSKSRKNSPEMRGKLVVRRAVRSRFWNTPNPDKPEPNRKIA